MRRIYEPQASRVNLRPLASALPLSVAAFSPSLSLSYASFSLSLSLSSLSRQACRMNLALYTFLGGDAQPKYLGLC